MLKLLTPKLSFINASQPRFHGPFCVLAIVLAFSLPVVAQKPLRGNSPRAAGSVPQTVLLRVIRAEDERRWDKDLLDLLADRSPAVRRRAALAAGRIGNELAVPALASLLQTDPVDDVRAMAAFALGETEAATAGDVLAGELAKSQPTTKARLIEALGKVIAALPAADETRLKSFRKAIYSALEFEAGRRSAPDTDVILLGVTAALRARPEGVGKVIAEFLTYGDARIRSDSANALARLRAKDGNETLRKLLVSDPDANVRANAARVLGATEDKAAFEGLLDRAVNEPDQRVRVSAIRALGSLKDSRATANLLKRGESLRAHQERNELLEIATVLGRIEQNSKSQSTIDLLRQLRSYDAPEVEIALVRIAPQLYTVDLQQIPESSTWQRVGAMGQAATELTTLKSGDALTDATIKTEALRNLTSRLSCPQQATRRGGVKTKITPGMVVGTLCTPISLKAVPDWLRALAAFKPNDLDVILRKYLKDRDVTVRAAAAELIGELPLNITNIEALSAALTVALRDKESNDAALAILDALAKQKNRNANEAIKVALDSSDYLVRRKAVDSLKATGAGDFSARLGAVYLRNSAADYGRAISRIGKRVVAIVSTTKGSFTIEFLPEDAPLNVDNFVQLAKRRYFNGITFHRVVPNFVVQGGDPRGDGNGGPGYQIRCEINEERYDRGAVGMALSGKDTGGSQWFVTHAPQPHLDGGYTVFGKVVAGMDVVDKIVRGDRIHSIVIKENRHREAK